MLGKRLRERLGFTVVAEHEFLIDARGTREV
jgi:hypothetical protein